MSMVLYMLELLKNEDDDRLECLCELLKAVGEKLENTLNISYFFIKMQEIMDKESTNISCYVRFVNIFKFELLIEKSVSVTFHAVFFLRIIIRNMESYLGTVQYHHPRDAHPVSKAWDEMI